MSQANAVGYRLSKESYVVPPHSINRGQSFDGAVYKRLHVPLFPELEECLCSDDANCSGRKKDKNFDDGSSGLGTGDTELLHLGLEGRSFCRPPPAGRDGCPLHASQYGLSTNEGSRCHHSGTEARGPCCAVRASDVSRRSTAESWSACIDTARRLSFRPR